MRKIALSLAAALLAVAPAAADEGGAAHTHAKAPAGVKLENLMKEVLERVEGTEVIVSRVTIPPNTALPKHWHPGEEFAYVIEGTVTLWQEGKEDIVGKAGDAMKVPLRQVHTAFTSEEGAQLLVFRVHEQGQPERILVE